jgi:transcriptional regulator of acetoin/glycerol metabolism
MKKKAGKIILSLLSLFLVAVIAFFANAFFGNPVSKALAKNAGNRKATAVELGLSERTLYRKIKDYGL